nr:hypothetical protein [uncultured Acinetobacter sp.]
MKNLIKGIALTTFAVLLTACSKPDISGVWIPENVSKDSVFYSYYVVKKIENSDRYSVEQHKFRIKKPNPLLPIELPEKISETQKVIEFTKDNTYCVEGSMETECFIAVDDKLDGYKGVRLKKTSTFPPQIPVNE